MKKNYFMGFSYFPRNKGTLFCDSIRKLANNWQFTFKSKEKVAPFWSWNCPVLSLLWDTSRLNSSHFPFTFTLDRALKFVLVQHSFLKQRRLQDMKLTESNRLKTRPFKRLSSFTVKNAERGNMELSLAAIIVISINRIKKTSFVPSITLASFSRSNVRLAFWKKLFKTMIMLMSFPLIS